MPLLLLFENKSSRLRKLLWGQRGMVTFKYDLYQIVELQSVLESADQKFQLTTKFLSYKDEKVPQLFPKI